MVDSSTNAVTSVDSLKVISYEDTYAGRVVNFEVDAFDVRASKLRFNIVMGTIDYGKSGALFLTPNMVLDNKVYDADVPATKLSYTVEMIDMDLGSGQIKFSHAINMEWLEDNMTSFWNIYLVDKESGLNFALKDFQPEFDSQDDGRVVDFTGATYDADDKTLTVDIAMDQEDYSRSGALFVLSSGDSGF